MEGVYTPDSLTRRLSRERALLLGGPRALILQVAHPLVDTTLEVYPRYILHPPLRFVPRSAYAPMVAITTALLPRPVRELFDLHLIPWRRRMAEWSQPVVRGILPVLPRIVREMPQART